MPVAAGKAQQSLRVQGEVKSILAFIVASKTLPDIS